MVTVITQRFLKYSLKCFLLFQRYTGLKKASEHYYFAYGSNLQIRRLLSFNIAAIDAGIAFLPEYKINFSLPCEYKGKGFANIEPCEGEETWGNLFLINSEGMIMLDILEWVPFKFYSRVKVKIKLPNMIEKEAWTYIARSPEPDRVPSKSYLNHIVQSARAIGLPGWYIEKVSNFSSKDIFELDPGFRLSSPSKRRIFENILRSVYLKHDKARERLTKVIP